MPRDFDGLEKMKDLSMGKVVKLHNVAGLSRTFREKTIGVDGQGNEVVSNTTSFPLKIDLMRMQASPKRHSKRPSTVDRKPSIF